MPIPNINNVVLTGRLVRDPELRVLPSGPVFATCASRSTPEHAEARDKFV
jgi:single-stranded DNA-binding protein